jgi:hypothetical protein
MTEEVRNAVIGNVGTFISFRVGSTDAFVMEKEFAPTFTQEDMVNLGFAQIYLKLMIDGMGSRPFSATTLPPIPRPEKSYVIDILGYSRKHFAKTKEQVDAEIRKWANKDFHLENVKYLEEKKKKGVAQGTGMNAAPTAGAGVLLNEMSGYDIQLQRDAEKLAAARPPKVTPTTLPPTGKLDTKVEIDKIVEDLLRGVGMSNVPLSSLPKIVPSNVVNPVVKSGDILGEQEIGDIHIVEPTKKSEPYLKVEKRDNKTRRNVLSDLQKDFSKSKADFKKQDLKTTNIKNLKKDNLEEIPEDILKALLDI